MRPWFAWILAIVSTAVWLKLWFQDVRRVMRKHLSTVESAAAQLESCREKAAEDGAMAEEVFARSESIYQQAVALYNRTLRKPWYAVPAQLMGFRPIGRGSATGRRRRA